MKGRRPFIAAIFGIGGAVLPTVALPPAAEPNYAVPNWFVRERGLKPIQDTKGFGVSAERIWVHGQDGKQYRLSDVISGLLRHVPASARFNKK